MFLVKIDLTKETLIFLLVIECTFNYPDGAQVSPFNLGTIDMVSDVGRILNVRDIQKRREKRSGKNHINIYKYFVGIAF